MDSAVYQGPADANWVTILLPLGEKLNVNTGYRQQQIDDHEGLSGRLCGDSLLLLDLVSDLLCDGGLFGGGGEDGGSVL